MYNFPLCKILVLVLISSSTLGQTKTFLNVKTIGLEEKLSSVNIRKIIYDKNGFLWLPTQDGLNKYDGKEIIQFNKNNTTKGHDLLGSDCYATSYSNGDSLLYVISSYEGLNIININTNTVIATVSSKEICQSKENVWIRSVADYKNYLIFGSDNKQLIYFNKETRKVVKTIYLHNTFSNGLWNIFLKDNNLGVVYQNAGIEIYDAENFILKNRFDYTTKALKEAVINQITTKENDIWFATNTGIYVKNFASGIEKNMEKWLPNNDFLKPNSYTSSIHFNKNVVFIGTNNSLFKYDLDSNKYNELEVNEQNKKNYLKLANTIIFTDYNIWIGGTYGLAQLNNNAAAFSSYYNDEANNKIEHIYSLFANDNNEVFAAADEGFYKVNVNSISIKQILSDQSVYSFGEINKDEYIISGTKNLLIYKNNKLDKISSFYPEFRFIEKELFISIQKINDSIVMLGSQLGTGLYIWNKKLHRIDRQNKNSALPIKDLLINRIWNYRKDSTIIISESCIQSINLGTNTITTLFTKEKLLPEKTDVFMDMCKQGNNFWIAGYGLGMIQVDNQFKVIKVISTKQGICNLGIYRIFSIGDSIVIGTTNNGLCIYNIKTNKVLNYFKNDGLHSNAFEETSGYLKNDSLFIGGIKGFTIFFAKNYTSNTSAPKLYFTNISISADKKIIDSTNLFIRYLQIPNNATQTKISFIGLNYQNANRVQYWYRIKGLQNDWISLGTQNFVDLIGISPGTYTLQVKAANEDGIESAPIELTLVFLPKWYQTWWFKVFLALSLIGIGFGLYKMRVAQIIKEQKIKNALASDLHDELGSSLTGLKLYAYQAKKNPEYMASLEEGITQSIKQVREMIWQLNEEKLTVHDLINKLAIIYKPLLKIGNTELYINIDATVASVELLNKEKSHLYLILKEIINNALKYSQASELNITVQKGKNRLLFTIADNGIGIQDERKGYGLKNIEQRAKEIKYNITRSSTNTGTIYTIAK